MQIKKQELEPDMEQWNSSKLGKEYVKSVYYHPVYLTYVQSTSWETERLLLNHVNIPGFLAPGGEEFNPGPEIAQSFCEIKFY